MTEEEQQDDGLVWGVKFSEDCSLLALLRMRNLEMWKTSTWERLWSLPCEGNNINFSPDGLQVLVKSDREKVHAFDVLSGDELGEIDSMPNSMHDHVHMLPREVRGIWQCSKCESSPSKNGGYWFTESDRWLWVVEEGVARRLIHIPAEYDTHDIQGCQGYVAFNWLNGLIVLDTGRNSKVQ